MRTPAYVLGVLLMAAPLLGETPAATPPPTPAPPAATPAPPERPARPARARSVTYSANGVETTRYFTWQMNEETGLSIIETATLGGEKVATPASEAAWLMGVLGFKPADAATPTPAAEEGRDMRRPRRAVTGPDGAKYQTARAPGRDGDPTETTTYPAGPNGEQVSKVEAWMKGDDGSWAIDTQPRGGWGGPRGDREGGPGEGRPRQRPGRPGASAS